MKTSDENIHQPGLSRTDNVVAYLCDTHVMVINKMIVMYLDF